ncbi:ABC transporter ATP-binding protein [Streptomyces europaeiscabiei]|uniref:ABC transporter ATP-binding protein n=1 Tax=Streptomyces europaeiscabiei TaxID=146819 RepID=UPI0029BD3007|nr:ABC transporter ATP-binding protein [Streptomyces europaeiscabiei]MDX2523200.1 ABC transporter ATP-binding protein [Streptomyces europaeiscabiei]MDX3775854.1 ABC transporter ATP-binding protein [Streptomyces europaeiscabiei]
MNESWDPAGPAVAVRAVTKTYANGVRAVRGVDLDVPAGEIRAVVGENGAGKSTLMKLFYGLEQPTSGEILIGGRPRVLRGPASAIALGVGMVHQNLMLVPSFTVAQNVVLGVEPGRRGLVDAKAAVEATARLAEEAGLAVDPLARVEAVSVGMRQRAEILKALHRRARVLILDEPTAVLTPQEAEDLFAAVRRLRDGGMTVLFISHKLREVREISDRVSVMRAGALVGTVDTADTTEHSLAAMMVGREMSLDVARARARRAGTTLRVRGLAHTAPTGQSLHGLDFDVAAGEIVGVAGIEGNGQTELAEILAGLRRPGAGSVHVGDTDTAGLDVAGHRRAGVGYVPEDRLHDGAALDESIADNLVVDRHDRPPLARRGVLRPAAIRSHAERLIEDYAIRTPDPSVPVRALSGGNMQKVVVARELSARPRLLIASQVTRGVDVGAMRFMYERLVAARDEGAAVLLISADLTELLALSDRLLVLKDGRLVARFDDTTGLTEKRVGLYMLGVEQHERGRLTEGLDGTAGAGGAAGAGGTGVGGPADASGPAPTGPAPGPAPAPAPGPGPVPGPDPAPGPHADTGPGQGSTTDPNDAGSGDPGKASTE